jgi:hypothetical protein
LVLGVLALVFWGGSFWLFVILFCVVGGCMKGGASWQIDDYYDDGEKHKRKREEYFDDTREQGASWHGRHSHPEHGSHMRWSGRNHHGRSHTRRGMCGPSFRFDDGDSRKRKHDYDAEKPRRDTIRTVDGEEFEIID